MDDDGIKKVPAKEILKELDADSSGKGKAGAKELEPLQRIGLWLALAFFGYILIVSTAIFFVSFRCFQIPAFPVPPPSQGDLEQYKHLLDAYKQSSEIYQQMAKLQVERATQLFQLVVASTILPVFGAILGYIFGSKKSAE